MGVDARTLVTAADVQAAAARLEGAVERTPMHRSETLSAIAGAEVLVKFENHQFTASFKERGARNRLLLLDDVERERGVVCMSAGNHGQGLAYHARLLGVPATVVMPEHTPFSKVRRTEAHGARVLLRGPTLREARAFAHDLAARERLTFISPFDDAAVIAGQGTVALEMLEDEPGLDDLIAPAGGGGLVLGMAVAAAAIAPDVNVVGVQSEHYAGLWAALQGVAPPVGGPTIAEGIAVIDQGDLTLPLAQALELEVLRVSEARIEEAIALFLEVEKTVAEGAGAAGLAALLEHRDRFRGRRVGLVLSGGNIDLRLLAKVVVHALARRGELAHLTAVADDRPGALGEITALIGREGGNIVEVQHRRDRLGLDVIHAEVELVIETRDGAHAEAIARALRAAGIPATLST